MIVESKAEIVVRRLISKVVDEGFKVNTRFGFALHALPTLAIVKKPNSFEIDIDDFWLIDGESYLDRIEKYLHLVASKIKSSPYTRRMSIPVWYPVDHFSSTPPAITEVSFLHFNGKLNLTAYVRSLDVANYFVYDFEVLNSVLDRVCELSGMKKGSIGMLIAIPHVYERDLERIEKEYGHGKNKEFFGSCDEGTHIVEKDMASAWHSALEAVYKGMKKKTEWGSVFEGQNYCKFLPRLFVEVKKPEENQIHDKAPFTKEYGINYAHNYVIYAECIDRRTNYVKKGEGEVYTYAERARCCEADEVKVDQLYECIEKLRKNKHSRNCYVSISRPWDLLCDEPPCLRGYQFSSFLDKLLGIFYMRSNDVFGAMHANMFAFSLLTSYVSELTGFSSYEYYHFANDAHIYAESIKAVKEVLFPETPRILEFLNEKEV